MISELRQSQAEGPCTLDQASPWRMLWRGSLVRKDSMVLGSQVSLKASKMELFAMKSWQSGHCSCCSSTTCNAPEQIRMCQVQLDL